MATSYYTGQSCKPPQNRNQKGKRSESDKTGGCVRGSAQLPLEYLSLPTAEGVYCGEGLLFYFLVPRIRSYRKYPAAAQAEKSLKTKVSAPGAKLQAPGASRAVC